MDSKKQFAEKKKKHTWTGNYAKTLQNICTFFIYDEKQPLFVSNSTQFELLMQIIKCSLKNCYVIFFKSFAYLHRLMYI